MADHFSTERKEVNLEQLLRLKRSERPDASFWQEFDRKLKTRTLQELVEKDPWHVRLSHLVAAKAAPIAGVAAAVALVFGFSSRALLTRSELPGDPQAEVASVTADQQDEATATDMDPAISAPFVDEIIGQEMSASATSPTPANTDTAGKEGLQRLFASHIKAAADFGVDVISVSQGRAVSFRKDHNFNSFQAGNSQRDIYDMDPVSGSGGSVFTF